MEFYEYLKQQGQQANAVAEKYAHSVIGAAIEVHRHLGPGLPENAYKLAMSRELTLRDVPHACEWPVDIVYKGANVGQARLDLLVGSCLIVELKAIDALGPVHRSQLITYLQVTGHELGLLINFNVELLKDGIKRVINKRKLK